MPLAGIIRLLFHICDSSYDSVNSRTILFWEYSLHEDVHTMSYSLIVVSHRGKDSFSSRSIVPLFLCSKGTQMNGTFTSKQCSTHNLFLLQVLPAIVTTMSRKPNLMAIITRNVKEDRQ